MKKILTLLVCALLMFGVVACDNGVWNPGLIGGVSKSESSSDVPDETSSSESIKENSDSSSSNSSSSNSTSSGGTVTTDIKPLSFGGLSESAYVTWEEANVSLARAYYKISSSSDYIEADGELIREVSSGVARVDYLGLKAGTYDFRIHIGHEDKDIEINDVTVVPYDRSGYAHFKYTSGVGAYKDDGTLKANAVVVYVTEQTKNTVKANNQTGLVKILNTSTVNKPVVVRIIGRINADTWTKSGVKEGKYTQIANITDKTNSNNTDTYFNMVDVTANSLTVEGVGPGAEAFQWGFTFKRCNSVEVRNMTFTDYPEDACSVEGEDGNEASYSRFWLHNNHFNKGKNAYDLTSEKDKGDGDGSTDLKFITYITVSYNSYLNCAKTGLIGGSNENKQYHFTFHHNYYKGCKTRTPLGRQANIHYYNNLFEGATSYVMSLRANAYVFSEANYILKCSKFRDSQSGGALKSFNDVFDGTSNKGSITEVTDRTKSVSSTCFYKDFDTKSDIFYYDSSKKVSDVIYLTSANQAKLDCTNFAGPFKPNQFY